MKILKRDCKGQAMNFKAILMVELLACNVTKQSLPELSQMQLRQFVGIG
jgi:hypothetical protein